MSPERLIFLITGIVGILGALAAIVSPYLLPWVKHLIERQNKDLPAVVQGQTIPAETYTDELMDELRTQRDQYRQERDAAQAEARSLRTQLEACQQRVYDLHTR